MEVKKITQEIEKKKIKKKVPWVEIGNWNKIKSSIKKVKKQQKKIIQEIEKKQKKKNLPLIQIGDWVKIKSIIQEGNKERVQPSEGTIIAQHRAGISTTITVRRNIGVERIFPIHSPLIVDIEIIRRAKVRKAKLYYLRTRIGKKTKLKERFIEKKTKLKE